MTRPLSIRFGPQTCAALDNGAQREWLVADGRGGYAMGTVSNLRTRRYHGLLVVAGETTASRHLALASLDPVVVLPSGAEVRLGVHEWAGGAVSPRGHELLESFELTDGLPTWRWRIGGVVVERTIAMVHGRSSVAVVHRLVSGGSVRLRLEALCTWRDAHGERHAGAPPAMEEVAGGVVVEGAYRLRGPNWTARGEWYAGAHAREEAARGLTADEDLWLAGTFQTDLALGDVAEVSAWAGDLAAEPADATAVVAAARERIRCLIAQSRAGSAEEAALVLAADSFVVEGPDVVAGYPWFGSWSRDTMTAYEGLFLCTRRAGEGRALLERYAATLSEGMLANTADTGQVEYNSADATLWFLHALGRHVSTTGDDDLAAAVLPHVDDILKAHVAGTRYGIRVDPADGLLTQGAAGYALTWMDARVNGIGVTPRIGKAVELNALWINGLAVAGQLRQRLGKDVTDVVSLEQRARSSFAHRFLTPGGWLLDVVDGPTGDDATMRPNQLLALSLPFGPGAPATVLDRVQDELLTPIGLRSLTPGDSAYRGLHRGGPNERDGAYHQGTVWPWLVGPFVAASARAGSDPGTVLDGLVGHLAEWGLGSVSETADGEAPHRATGCPFQAWSVAETLRAYQLTRTGSAPRRPRPRSH